MVRHSPHTKWHVSEDGLVKIYMDGATTLANNLEGVRVVIRDWRVIPPKR